MFRKNIENDFRKEIEKHLIKAKEELNIEFEIKDIIIYGSSIHKDDPNDVDIFVELNIDLDNSDALYQDFSFEKYKSKEFYDGEIEAKNIIHEFLHGEILGLKQPQYKNKYLDINVELSDFYQYGFSCAENDNFEELDTFLINNERMRKKEQYNDMLKSDKQNVYNSTEAQEKFIELAEAQRDKPERKMLEVQRLIGGGVMNGMVEHIGDLTHRMSQGIYIKYGDVSDSIKDIYPKLERCLRTLKHEYGFEREMMENLQNNFEYQNPDQYKEKYEDFELFLEDSFSILQDYSNLHSELAVYNQAQWLAREAAVSLGQMKVQQTIKYLENLKEMIDKETFFYEASQFDPNFENNFKPHIKQLYHGTNQSFEQINPNLLGQKITSLGTGFYLTDDIQLARQYGKNIMVFNVDSSNILDWNNLTLPQRLQIEKELLNSIPKERIAGFGNVVEEVVGVNADGLKRFNQLKQKTKHYYHESAKATTKYNKDDTITISYRKSSSLKKANNQQLMTLMNEYRPELAKELGYHGASFSNQIAIYNLDSLEISKALTNNKNRNKKIF